MERKEFMQTIQNGGLRGAYLLEGPEENLKATALAALRQALLPEGLEELNETILEAPPTDALIAAAETLPFLADKRLVLVREHPGLTGRGESDERLAQYIGQLPESCVLVFWAQGKADARKKLYQAIKKKGAIVSFSAMNDAELNGWIRSAFTALGKDCSQQTASLLSFTVGNSTALLKQEISKLAALAADRSVITDEDVRAVATRSIECTVFEMVDAVVARQEGRAFALLRDMLTNGEERLGILAMLLRQYRLLQHVKIMQFEKKTAQTIKTSLGIPPFAAERCIRQAAAYTGGEIKQAVDICLTTELNVKSGRYHDEGALESAMLSLFALRRPQA